MTELLTSAHTTVIQMTAITTSSICMLAGCPLLLNQKQLSTCQPFPMRPRRRIALRRALGCSLLAVGVLGITRTAFSDWLPDSVFHTTMASALLTLFAYIALAMMGSRLARPDIAAGNAALTLLFPVLHTCSVSEPDMQSATMTIFYCYYSMQIGVYTAVFVIERNRCDNSTGRLYASRIFIPAAILGIWSAIGWTVPSAASAIAFMIVATLYLLYLTIIFLKHTFRKRHIS